jgi:tetratricopeptide (TPR) repeat protein
VSIGRQGQSGTVTLGAERGNARRRGRLRARGGGLWQVPVLGAGAILLVAGAATAFLTKPGPDHRPAVERAARLVERERWVEAIETLNTEVYPYLENGTAPRDVARGYHQLLARAIAGGQHELDVRSAVNDQNVISQFLEAERLDASLTPLDVALLAESYIALGRYEEAEQRIATIPDTYPEIRERLVRDMIETKLGLEQPLYTDALEALGRVLAETTISDGQRLWALARQAEVRLELGLEDEAVTSLLRELPLLQQADPAAVGSSTCGWGGRTSGWMRSRRRSGSCGGRTGTRCCPRATSGGRWRGCTSRISRRGGRRGRTGWSGRGDGYANLVERSGATAAFLPALMGMGEMEAALDNPRGSIDAYQALVQERSRGRACGTRRGRRSRGVCSGGSRSGRRRGM